MVIKDWILLVVPILFNGIVVLVLQKIFEKKQFIRSMKMQYVSEMIRRIDISLEAHSKATRLSNEKNPNNEKAINESVWLFINNGFDIYYYNVANKNIFSSQSSRFERLGNQLVEICNINNNDINNNDINNNDIKHYSISILINSCRDTLIDIKDSCIQYNL